ncbi:MAG: adenylate/guanylate cyclase domain-containing protein [Pseudomonadota bacterium]
MKNLRNNGIHTSGYTDRLAKLISERLEPGADKARIDQRIWDLFGEEWAVMFTDLAGFSRCAADFGIIHFLQIIEESRRIFSPCIDEWDGILIKVEGDSMLLLFKTPRNAVECAIAMQRRCDEYNQGRVDEEKVLLCLGIGYGSVLNIGGEDVFGAEVNAAAKLGEDTAVAWEILVTDSVAKEIEGMPGIELEGTEFVPHGAKAAYRVLYRL